MADLAALFGNFWVEMECRGEEVVLNADGFICS